ncbi:MAG: hypothetical protein AAGJ35_15425, partial [Myxococcota bacterium]
MQEQLQDVKHVEFAQREASQYMLTADRVGWLAFLCPFVVWVFFLPSTPVWFRGMGTYTAIFSLQQVSSWQHPLASLFFHGTSLVPLGSLSFRLMFASALLGGLGSWLMYHSLCRMAVMLMRLQNRLGVWERLCALVWTVGVVLCSNVFSAQGWPSTSLFLVCC